MQEDRQGKAELAQYQDEVRASQSLPTCPCRLHDSMMQGTEHLSLPPAWPAFAHKYDTMCSLTLA